MRNLRLTSDEVHELIPNEQAAANLVESLSSTEFLPALRGAYRWIDHPANETMTIKDTLGAIAGESVVAQRLTLRFLIRQLQVAH
jgi:hypothetical protein